MCQKQMVASEGDPIVEQSEEASEYLRLHCLTEKFVEQKIPAGEKYQLQEYFAKQIQIRKVHNLAEVSQPVQDFAACSSIELG